MVIAADRMWRMSNANRYVCTVCDFQTCNKNHYVRHCRTVKHFMLKTFSQAPFEIKVIVATYLRCDKLSRAGRVGIAAMRLRYPPTRWRRHATS